MSLLNTNDLLQIRNAIKLATDTFFITPVEYKLAIDSIDKFQEDREKEYTTYNLSALAEFPEDVVTEHEQDGANDFFDIKLTFNVEDLEAISGVWDAATNRVPFIASADRFTAKGKEYRVSFVGYDGPLEDKPVLVIVKGRLLNNSREL